MTEDEQSDVLAGKQVETGGGGLIGLRPVVEYRVQSETVLEGEFGIVPRSDEGQLMVLDTDGEILEVQAVHRKGKSRQILDGCAEMEGHLEATTVHPYDRFDLCIQQTGFQQGNECITGAVEHEVTLGIHLQLRHRVLQGCLHHGCGRYGMSHLEGCQQLGKVLHHLCLHGLQVAGTLIRLIGHGCDHQLENGVTLKSFKLVVVIALPPDVESLAQQLLCPLFGFKYRLFHSILNFLINSTL